MNTQAKTEILAEIKSLSELLSQSSELDTTLDLISGIEELKDELLYTSYDPDEEDDVSIRFNLLEAQGVAGNNKLAVVVGHTGSAPGACGVSPVDSCEYFWNSAIASRMVEIAPSLGVNCSVFYRDSGTATAYRRADAWGARAIIELHYNAASATATGTETLWGKQVSIPFAQSAQRRMVALLGLRDRGLVDRSVSGRGHYNLTRSNNPSIIVEPFFGSRRGDATTGQQNKMALATAYINAFKDTFNL